MHQVPIHITLVHFSGSLEAGCEPDGDKVLEGLGHFEALYGQVASVQEVVDPLLAATAVVVRLSLGQLIVMVREAQVLTPTVDVDPVPDDSAGHG